MRAMNSYGIAQIENRQCRRSLRLRGPMWKMTRLQRVSLYTGMSLRTIYGQAHTSLHAFLRTSFCKHSVMLARPTFSRWMWFRSRTWLFLVPSLINLSVCPTHCSQWWQRHSPKMYGRWLTQRPCTSMILLSGRQNCTEIGFIGTKRYRTWLYSP